MAEGHRVTDDILQVSAAFQLGLRTDEVKVRSAKVTKGANKGDGYACVMKAVELTAEVKGEEEKLFFMAKCVPLNELRAAMLIEGKIFDVEVTMLTKIIPRLRELQPRLSVPRAYYGDSKAGIIVMEDLKRQGYFLVDKTKHLELPHVKLVLEQLAILHSTSYHFIETYPKHPSFKNDFPELHTDNHFLETSDSAKPFKDLMLQLEELFIAIIEEHCPDKPGLVRKLKDFALRRRDIVAALQLAQGSFNCILHNDAHTNNFLFRNYGRACNVDQVKILDLQLSRVARPSVDLAFFFGTSTGPEFRKDRLEEMLQFYHYKLTQSLESFGYDKSVYSYEQLRKDYSACYAFGYSMSQMRMMHMSPPDNEDVTFDVEKVKEDDANADDERARRFRDGWMRLAREDEAIRKDLILIAMEAEEMGVI